MQIVVFGPVQAGEKRNEFMGLPGSNFAIPLAPVLNNPVIWWGERSREPAKCSVEPACRAGA